MRDVFRYLDAHNSLHRATLPKLDRLANKREADKIGRICPDAGIEAVL